MLIIDNSKSTTQYYSLNERSFVDPTQKISRSLLTMKSFEAHQKNQTLYPIHLNEYQPVLPGVFPIPARTKWSYENGSFKKLKKNIKLAQNMSYETIFKNSLRLLKITKGRIAVELSGGLDSSIIIGGLKRLGYEPVLIGIISQLYKFRTERHIQELIAQEFKDVVVWGSDGMQFSNLIETPPHFLPNFWSLNHSQVMDELQLLKKYGVKYIFHGTAFDSVLVEPVENNPNDLRWPPLENNWLNDYVLSPQGISYVDVAALSPIKQMLLSLRNGRKQDVQKWWARQFFSEIIPRELSQYAYKASYGPQWWDGLLKNSDQMLHITKVALKETGLSVFKDFSVKTLFDSMSNGTTKESFAVLVYANWVHALSKANRLI